MAKTRSLKEQQSIRFEALEWAAQTKRLQVTVVGLGGIGSWATIGLTRAGYKVHLYDHDNIEGVNFAGQFYRTIDIGHMKMETIATLSRSFTPGADVIMSGERKFVSTSQCNYIVFSCLDSMTTRKEVFQAWKRTIPHHKREMQSIHDYMKNNPTAKDTLAVNIKPCVLVDGRLLAEQFQVLFVTPETADRYEREYLFGDEEVDDIACTNRQTSHMAMGIASIMVQGLNNVLQNDVTGEKLREVPFYYEHEGFLFSSNSIFV